MMRPLHSTKNRFPSFIFGKRIKLAVKYIKKTEVLVLTLHEKKTNKEAFRVVIFELKPFLFFERSYATGNTLDSVQKTLQTLHDL